MSLAERVYDARVSGPIVLPDPPLTDGRVTLRAWHAADVPAIVAMCRDPEVIRFTSVPVPYDADDARLWLDLHPARMQLTTSVDNPASQRVAERTGFRREGVLRAWAENRGRRVDLVMYSRLPGDA